MSKQRLFGGLADFALCHMRLLVSSLRFLCDLLILPCHHAAGTIRPPTNPLGRSPRRSAFRFLRQDSQFKSGGLDTNSNIYICGEMCGCVKLRRDYILFQFLPFLTPSSA